MNELMKFQHDVFGEIHVVDQNDEPWFIAKDVCDILQLSVRDSVRYLDDDEKADVSKEHVSSNGVKQHRNFKIINESGLYSLILKSRKPEAKNFKKWITAEVLPSIRKTGNYSVPQLSPAEIMLEQAKLLVELEKKTSKALEVSDRALEISTEVSQRLNQIETANDHFTVMGYSSLNNLHLPLPKANMYGKKASAFCRANNIEMGLVPDPRFGKVNTYPLYVLQQIVDEE